ncbi:hypothetical protein CCASP_02530 [Corynebacterium caspium DSM 44850]|nr:hypothetical protein CCASP_02530 [Corynebacterium caspium DSM 44850]
MPMKIFKFEVDPYWAKQHNELIRDVRRLQWNVLFFALLFGVIGVVAYFFVQPQTLALLALISGIAVAIIFIIVALVLPKKLGSAQDLYNKHPLAPAIIAEVTAAHILLMALVNLNVDPDIEPRWGLVIRPVNRIKGHKRAVCTKIPCAAVGGRRNPGAADTWQQISPMPIAWGTPDTDIIAFARKAIPTKQWQLLEKSRIRLPELKASRTGILPL